MARKADLYLDELILLAAGAWLAVGHIRMLIIFGILAAPTLSRQLANVWENYEPEKDRILPNAVFIGLSLVAIVLAFPSRQNLEQQVEANSPVKALQYVQAHQLTGPMLNDYTYGGYLIWAAPEHPVMIDGRTDIYEWSGFLEQYARWATLQEDPNLLLQKYNVNFCLLNTHSQMINVLPLLPDWKLVYSDDLARVFVRTPSQRPEPAINCTLGVHVVFLRSCHHQSALLPTVNVPAAPAGLVWRPIRWSSQIAISDFSIKEDALFPVLDASESLIRSA